MSQLQLPVEQILDQLKHTLAKRNHAVLQAPPGTGKTTLVPLALRVQPWLKNNKILMLEPRRIATRAAAHRMSALINESPGQTVGYRMRLDSRTGPRTRIEVITEGILTRMLQDDPALDGVGLVIFDEFHERNLDSDLAMALCQQAGELFREKNNPLKILVMSATIDADAIAQLLDNAAIIHCEGRSHAVEIIYHSARKPQNDPVEKLVATVKQALDDNPDSSLLAFLPGQGEIRRSAELLGDWLKNSRHSDLQLYPLYGNLSIEQQQKAIAPLPAGQRKLVLATNIAETSLTIEGVNIVVDSGLAREPRFDPSTAMSGLVTVKISRASSEQRAGRAGRTAPGKCYRLWSEHQQQQLVAQTTPEILNADLSPLALQLLRWGVDDPADLKWLDPPPRGAWQQAIDLLQSLGAVINKTGTLSLSLHGKNMAAIGIHPRLAHLLIRGAEMGFIKKASLLAGLLSERYPPGGDDVDINARLNLLSSQTSWSKRVHQQARQYRELINRFVPADRVSRALNDEQVIAYLLACAYPDRIARRRHSGTYQLANGRSASLAEEASLSTSPWLAIAEVTTSTGARSDTIRSAGRLDKVLFATILKEMISLETVTEWDKKTGRFIAEQRQKIGALVLQKKTLTEIPKDLKNQALIDYLKSEGLSQLPWKSEHEQWLARVALLRRFDDGGKWPDLSMENLHIHPEQWLAPYLTRVNTLKDLKKLNLRNILQSMLNWEQQQRLNELAPTHLKVPSGSSIAIDYSETPPILAVKLQEMFGCQENPAIVKGKIPLVVHLLSPAGRPLQVTQDLEGFWKNTYHDVKKEMKGRYPKHPWPDDPMSAIPTRKTKKQKIQNSN